MVAVSVPAVPPALAGETPTGDHQEVDQWDPVDPWVLVDLWDPEDLGWDLEDLGWDLEDLGWDPEVRGWVVQVDQCRPGCRDLEARECLDQVFKCYFNKQTFDHLTICSNNKMCRPILV